MDGQPSESPIPPAQFPPPTLPSPEPAAVETPMSVVVEEPPKRRRTGLLVGVAVVVVAALAVGGFLLLSGDDAPTYSLDEATATAVAADTGAFHMAMSTMGTDIDIDAEVDKPAKLMHMTMDLGSGALGVDGPLEMIVDMDQQVIYMDASLFAQLGLPVDTDWIKMDREAMEAAGQDASAFDQFDVGNPLDATSVFDRAESVETIGFEEIDGEKVQHYEITVSIDELLKVDDTLQQQAEDLGGELPDTVVYDAFVNEANQLRQMSYELDFGVGTVKTVITFKDVTEPLDISVPADDDVTNLVDLL